MPDNSSMMIVVVLIVVAICCSVFLVAGGGAGWWFFIRDEEKTPTAATAISSSSKSSSLVLLESKLDKIWDGGVPYGIDTAKYKAKIPEIAQAILDNCGTNSFDDCVGYAQYMLHMDGAINWVYQKDNTKLSQLPVPWTVYKFDCTSVQKDLTSQELVPLFNSVSAQIEKNIAKIPSTSTINIEKIKQYVTQLTIRSMFYSTCKGGTKESDYTGCTDWIVYILNKPSYLYQFQGKEPPAGDWSYGFDGALVQK
jgi:hypothetical protein